jgi:predicted DNA-binding transcriptional regulator AlpA
MRRETQEANMTASEYIDTNALADRIGIAASTLAKLRLTGTGPVYRRVNRRVIYRWSDVETWLDGCARQSTGDA